MKIKLEEYLPLNNKESIKILLDDIEQCLDLFNNHEIGQVLIHIKKVKLQLFFKNRIDEINKKAKTSKRMLAIEQKKKSINIDEGNIVYTTHTLYDIPIMPSKAAKVAKSDKSKI